MKKATKQILIFAGAASVLAWLLIQKNGNSLFGFCNTKYQKCWQRHQYNQSQVTAAVKKGADTFEEWYDNLSPQELTWVKTLPHDTQEQSYYEGYIVPWLHGLYGGPGGGKSNHSSARHWQGGVTQHGGKYYAACGQQIPYDLWLDQRRGAQQGEGGAG